jgi:O-acetyl-ADP-ribose deacetylase (regulator of RNase III)
MHRMKVITADITTLAVEAVVNAANASLLGGGGVDGAIHRKAGPALLLECMRLQGCDPGDAKITSGYDLPAGRVIHTVGPVWHGGVHGEDSVLSSCYRRSLEVAREHGVASVAFPAISTGLYGFPADRAALIATETVGRFLERDRGLREVIFCCFDEDTAEFHRQALEALEVRP